MKTWSTRSSGISRASQAIAEDGALEIGPFNVWVQRPAWGRPIWELLKVVSVSPALPRAVREVAILVTGAHFRSAYEIYAHVALAESRGLDDDKISTIVAGQRPNTLTREEAIAYDVTSALVSGYVLPEVTYRQAVGDIRNEQRHGADLSRRRVLFRFGHAQRFRRACAR